MASRTEYRAFQIAIGIAGLVPVGAGLAGVLAGAGMMGASAASVGLDSHVRYLSGVLLGIGLIFWALIPTINRRKTVVRTLTLVVFVGGLGRLFGFFAQGLPDGGNTLAIVMELVVTPLLCAWQARFAGSGGGALPTQPARTM